MKKNNILLYLCVAIFGVLGIYLTFIAENINKYDSQTKAYDINPNERYDSDRGTIYKPIYYFKVNGRDYECETNSSSSSYPSEKKNIVYYDSKNPTNCQTEYDKSTNKIAGIICLIATAVIVYFFIIKKPSNDIGNYNQMQESNLKSQFQVGEEDAERIIETVGKIQLIYKRVILGVIIVILLFLILFETYIVKQTIVSKDYLEATAIFVNKNVSEEDSLFDDCVYTFNDKQGRQQEIIISVSKGEVPEQEIKLKYNENNPQDYYEEGATMDKSGIVWYIVKIVALILLIILFFNKKLLNKISIGVSRK